MQAVFSAAYDGDPKAVFRDEEQFNAYTTGLSKENIKNVAVSNKGVDMGAVDDRGRSDDED